MKKIGLTGGIASGKSTAVKILIKYGFKIIDSDKIVKDILGHDREVFYYIRDNFGDEFICGNSILNKKFGEYIFTYGQERVKYEDFIMPKIFRRIYEEFSEHEKNGETICILDAPLLIEKGLHIDMDYIILVWIDREKQISRLMRRDNISREDSLKRINAQIDIDIKKQFANFIIDNSKDVESLERQIHSLGLFLRTL